MFKKSGLLIFVLTILQISAWFQNEIPDPVDDVYDVDEINPDPAPMSSSRIVSGWLAEPGQHPHHAALLMMSAFGDSRVCGGSLISNEWVITSARCAVSRVRAVVRLGVVDITDNNPNNIYETTEWYTHPNFNNLSTALQSHGVTLLKLPRPVVYSWLVKPIRLQSRADAFRNYDGEQVYASGHGRTGSLNSNSRWLRWVYLRAITNEECSRTSPTGASFNTVICARYYNVTSQSTCYDDNGGPLVHVGSDGIPTLIGITFFFPATSIGCDVGRPTGFYRPGAFLSWIKDVTSIDFDTTTTTTTTTTPTTTTPTSTTPTTTTTTATPTSTTPTTTTTFPTTIPSTTTTPPAEEKEEEEDSDSSQCNDDEEMGQLLKRLQVDVKVKVALNKFKLMKTNDTSVINH